MQFSPSGKAFASISQDGTLSTYKFPEYNRYYTFLTGATGANCKLAYSKDESLIKVWDPEGSLQTVVESDEQAVRDNSKWHLLVWIISSHFIKR